MTLDTHSTNKLTTPIGLLITLVLFMSGLVAPRLISASAHLNVAPSVTFILSRALLWCTLMTMYWYAIKIEKQPLVIWKEQSYGISFYLISLVLLLLCVLISGVLIALLLKFFNLYHHSIALTRLKSFNIPLKLIGIVTAAVVEEFVFRAYLIPRLQLYLKYGWLTVATSAIIFGLVHFGYGTIVNMVIPICVGLVFGFHYYKYKNLKVLILCHSLIDFYALVIQHQHSR